MQASQYIYTACGKDRNGAFSVFSKSKDITEQESNEIREVMMYKTPPGLPYEPTEQEIQDLFPVKFGYFALSSGRVCLAQASYIGRVYSDHDSRTGNYIIHGFVFNKTPGFSPYSFIDNNIFKRFLTKKEWHDDPIPDSYPQIELPQAGSITPQEISGFIKEDRINKLKLIIEAVINSSQENYVCFLDDHKNLTYWLKALSVCIPKSIQNEISLCTHFTNSIIPGNISSRVQVRANQPEGGMFNYSQEAARGRYAFDFKRNIIPAAVKPGKYAESVAVKISQDFKEAILFVGDINNVMNEYSVKIDEASCLINMGKNELSFFENADELINTMQIADKAGYKTSDIAETLFSSDLPVSLNHEQNLLKYGFIYKYLTDKRLQIIKAVIENASQLGIAQDTPVSFRDDLHLKAKFIFDNYLNYLKKEGLSKYIDANKDSNNKIYLAFDCLVSMPNIKNAQEELNAVIKIMEEAFNKKSLKDLDLFIKCANSRSKGLGDDLLAEIVKKAFKTNSSPLYDIKFAFDILQRLKNKTDFACNYLLELVKIFHNKEDFLKTYIAFQQNEPNFTENFEKQKGNEPEVKDFLKKKDMLSFQNQPLTLEIIKKFFVKYFVKGEDKMGLLVKRLSYYLDGIQSEKKLPESLRVLDTLDMPAGSDIKLILPVHALVLNAVFSVPYQKIYEIRDKKEWKKIEEVYNTVINEGGNLKQETGELIIITICGKISEKYGFKEKPEKVYSFFNDENEDSQIMHAKLGKINSEKSVNLFNEYYFENIANILITGAASEKQLNLDFDGTIKKAFGKVIEKCDASLAAKKIIQGAKKTKPNVMVLLLYMLRKTFLQSDIPIDIKIAEIVYFYFKELSNGERKKVFENLKSMADNEEKKDFEKYIDKFNAENKPKSIFSGLFG